MPAMVERLTTSEAARVLSVSAETVRTWLRQGRLAAEITPLGALLDSQAVHDLAARCLGGRAGDAAKAGGGPVNRTARRQRSKWNKAYRPAHARPPARGVARARPAAPLDGLCWARRATA